MMSSFFSVVSEAVPGDVGVAGVSDQRGRDEMSGAAGAKEIRFEGFT